MQVPASADARPPDSDRQLSPIDRLLAGFDATLRSALGPHRATRPYPAQDIPETIADVAERKRIAGLMRVNHAGEMAAQGLYHGQALTARQGAVRAAMEIAAREEGDHLAWCEQRIQELGDRTSLLDPLWYAGSFAIGALAGISGDRNSLGFVAETERQVVEHLDSHLRQLPVDDARTRAIIKQMSSDEAQHGDNALAAGGVVPPPRIQNLMRLTARIMTSTARWV